MSNLKEILYKLKSSKITERQEGLAGIKTAFSKTSFLRTFHLTETNDKTEKRSWKIVFDALAVMINLEKIEYSRTVDKGKPPKPTVVKRLTDTARTIRMLVEKAVTFFGKTDTQVLVGHLYGGIFLRNGLMTPIALDYAKALKCILSFRPHLEHLRDDTWEDLVALGFNVVLGESSRGQLDQDIDSAVESGEETSNDKGELEEEEDEDELPVVKGKRKRETSRSGLSQMSASVSKPRRRGAKAASVSLEQVEFASILYILLGYSGAPILASDRSYLPRSILNRLERFLTLYPADSSLLYDYLPTLSSVLDHLALNHVKDTQRFARNTWDILIGLWNTKDKSLREHLIVVIRALMPYLTADFGLKSFRDPYDQAGALWKLYNTLEGEADNRRGVETLALDSLRLEIYTGAAHEGMMEAFTAHTFRAGFNFDTRQAISWAILQTQADCVAKLYELSESMNSGATPVPLRGEKKRKLDNGISSILSGIQTGLSQHARIFNLQVLLFLIDRNWLSIHLTLKHHIIDSLLQLVALEDTSIQTWTLLCLAAIVYAERFLAKVKDVTLPSQSLESQSQAGFETGTWDSVWTHSIRRINSPPTCRAASHTAYTLIYQAVGSLTISLPSQRILSEIEILSSDLEVQGPAYPYDSVCNFLAQCVNLAGQDARLYRIHLEDKVVGWIIDHWKVTATAKIRSMPPTLQDGVNLLEAICGFSRKSHLISRGMLPSCDVATALQREISEERVRDFLLSAQLPMPHSRSHLKIQDTTTPTTAEVDVGTNANDLSPPQARERKISAFFLRSIEVLTTEWEGIVENHTNVTADAAQQSLEHALTSLVFESLLVYNGVASNRHLIQASAKMLSTILPLLNSATWNYVEKATVLSALEPLILLENMDNSSWEVVLPPGMSSGIKRRMLNEIMDTSEDPTKQLKAARTNLLRILWRMPDAQNCLQNVVKVLRQLFCDMIASSDPAAMDNMGNETDERDGFGPVRDVAGRTGPPQFGIPEADPFILRTMEICLRFVVNGPLLHSLSGEPTKDTEVIDAVLACDVDNPKGFLVGFPLLLSNVQRGTFTLGSNLNPSLKVLEEILTSYKYRRSERLLQITFQLLSAILQSWFSSADIRKEVDELLDFLLNRHLSKQARYRSERDAFIRFVEQVIIFQPRSLEWVLAEKPTKEVLLTKLPLGLWNTDNDVRVRFCAATLNARIFNALQHLDISPSLFYSGLQEYLNRIEIDQHERVLSRFLALGNIIVASSCVRRGPYWHLIETCLFADQYSSHIEAILMSVSHCLGLTPSLLFEAYASQIGYSMIKSEGDISRIPPHLIGFEDRRQSAAFALSAFAPTYITSLNGSPFETHCKLVGVTPEDTYANGFGDIVGAVATDWFKMHPSPDIVQLEKLLQGNSYSRNFDQDLRNNADGVALAIIRSLSDQVLSPAGAIQQALQARSNRIAQAFTELVKYRPMDSHVSHESNLPAFEISIVLPTLSWLLGKVKDESKKSMTYHVLHGLFAAIYASPVVNEQIRLVNALSVWTALRCEDFDDPTLLHTLVQGSTALLAEYDLAHAAQSMLEWAFRSYRKLKLKDSAFSNIIIRVCSIAYDYARSQYPEFQKLGNVLMDWMDRQAIVLSKSAVQIQVIRALPTWPYVPVPELAQIAAEQSSEGLEALLDDSRITYNKFRLVRRLYDHISQGGRLKARFCKHDFWRLKDCIPAQTELQQDDADAFASLLILGHGDVSGITRDYQSHRSILTRCRPSKHNVDFNDPNLNNEIIIYSLLQLLDSHSAKSVFSAYETLRRIMAVLDNFAIPNGPSDYNSELEHLRAFPRRARTRSPCKLDEVVAPDTLLELTVDFNRWISILSSRLSDYLARYSPTYAQLSSVLLANAEFAADLLPILVHSILRTEIQKDKYVSKDRRRILTDYFTSVLNFEQASIACRQSIIDIVLHLREFLPQKEAALSYNEWLDVDFMLLAKNAVACGAYTTALLFLELSLDHSSAKPQRVNKQEDLLYEIYSHIDEPDGFYGIKPSDLQRFLIRRFHHEKQWDKALQFHGATVEADPNHFAGSDGLLQAFSSFGFNHLVMNTLRTPGSSSSAMDYRRGWRTETWDLPESKVFITGSSLYSSLRALYRERNPHIIDSITQQAISRTMNRLRSLGSENMTEIREIVQELMCLKEVKDWRDDISQLKFRNDNIKADDWSNLFDIDAHFDFSDLELLMETRISLLHSARQKEERQQIGTLVTPLCFVLKEIEKRCLLRLSRAARDENHVQIALNSIMRAQRLCNDSSIDVAEEYASVLWELKEQGAAIQYLQNIIRPLNKRQECDTQQAIYHVLLKARLGSWIATACLESPTAIWEKYLQKAVNDLETNNVIDAVSSKSRATVYHDCALFAERQYYLTLKSPDGIRWKVYVERKTQEVQHWNTQLAAAGDQRSREDFRGRQLTAQKVLQQDSEQFRKHLASRDQFLKQALEMYAKSLEVADTYDDDASIRFCSLWFANFESEGDLQDTIDIALSRIPSYKMVFLAHQLTARLSWPTGELPQCQQSLQKMILRMCKEHPFHSLYQVYCLLPERNISDFSRRQSGRLVAQTIPSTQTERGSAAQVVFDKLRADTAVQDKVAEVEKLCNASWQWAKFPVGKGTKYARLNYPYQIPPELLICRLPALRVPVPTFPLPLDPTMRYDNCVCIDSFEKQFQLVGGINLPKICSCKASNGKTYKQLFKGGNDDLRQDAVMEQVFDVVNGVLQRDRQTKRRELGVRGYKVIPLDSQTGLLEFVTNTTPLRAWLNVGRKRYRPTDMGADEVKHRHDKAWNIYLGDADRDKLLKVYYETRSKVKPVMRHYFTEKSKSPVTWFAMRLKYTRSVATTSIVGHILGLGDRHTSNILLDNSTGEVVHIDLGIAFDQGKLLRVPETVPFRMTPNMIDGMGSSGTTGVFQRCAEETLRVLRDGSDVIMTVLEVFKHDPLHSWTLSDTKYQNAQRHDQQQTAATTSTSDLQRHALGMDIGIDITSGGVEEAADRALSSVARKLDKSLSVEYTVNQLIAEATEPFNLASIYQGWQPHS